MSSSIDRLVRPHLRELQAYEPIEPPEVLAHRLGIAPEQIVKLNGNENPYGPAPRLRQTLAAYNDYQIYPDPFQREIRKALSEYTGLDPSHILAGAGCDELIDLALRATLDPDDEVIDCVPTFGMYAFSTQVCGGRRVVVERDESFDVDREAIENAMTDRTKVVFLCSPNNPTCNLVSKETLEAVLRREVLVVVDETYYEFSKRTHASLVPQHENLVVLRSLSKWAGLAGLRIGYGLMSPRLVEYLMALKPPYNINVAAEQALLASMEDRDLLLERIETLLDERDRLYASLQETPGIQPVRPTANFLFCRVTGGKPASDINQALIQKGIFVRYFAQPRLKDYLRITVGTPEQNDALLKGLRAALDGTA